MTGLENFSKPYCFCFNSIKWFMRVLCIYWPTVQTVKVMSNGRGKNPHLEKLWKIDPSHKFWWSKCLCFHLFYLRCTFVHFISEDFISCGWNLQNFSIFHILSAFLFNTTLQMMLWRNFSLSLDDVLCQLSVYLVFFLTFLTCVRDIQITKL